MMKSIIFCLVYAMLNVSGAAIIKWKLKGRMLKEMNDWINLLTDTSVIGAFVLIFVSALVLFKALSSSTFTFIVPVAIGINFILTVIAGYFIFRDHINLISLIGFLLIITGIIFLSINKVQHA